MRLAQDFCSDSMTLAQKFRTDSMQLAHVVLLIVLLLPEEAHNF
jgi:hypothetical protein